MPAKIEIFTSANCPYCTWAKRLLDRRGLAYKEFRIDLENKQREELSRRAADCRSVPQIFIDDTHIGGYDNLVEVDQNGGLDKLVPEN